MHVMGEKTWMVFQGRADAADQAPLFEGWPRSTTRRPRASCGARCACKPGDLLYLPRGQYHYALADDGACAHIAFGVTYPIGMDAVSYGFERMIGEAVGRANLPREREALQARLAEIGRALAERLADAQAVDDMLRFCAGFRWPRETYDLPGLIEDAEERLPVKGAGLRLVSQGGRHGLVTRGQPPGGRGAGGDPAACRLGAGPRAVRRASWPRRSLAMTSPRARSACW